MSLDDFGTMLACLMKVCWASIAGQLHLATDKDTSTLRAGLCSKVDSVSLKVRSLKCFIACIVTMVTRAIVTMRTYHHSNICACICYYYNVYIYHYRNICICIVVMTTLVYYQYNIILSYILP